MIGLLRYLFVVQHDYHDSAQAMRARVVLPLVGTMTLLAIVFGLYLIGAAVVGDGIQSSALTITPLIAPALIVFSGLTLWLVQRGSISAATVVMGLILGAMAATSLYSDGIAPSPVLMVGVLLAYTGLVYGARGIVSITILIWIALPVIAYLQSEGQLKAETAPSDELIREALISAQMLSLIAVLLWLFSWNLQRALARTARLATQTRATAATGQTISRILNMHELLTNAVDVIRDRFALYHVQIFLVDDARTYANLTASTGSIGQALLDQGFRVPVGPRTAAGEAISTGELRYVRDISKTAYRHPELLADARSELAIPLATADEVTGVLDILSARPGAFGEEDIEAMRILANQLSQSVQNARLFETQQRGLLQNRRLFLDSETNLREIERLNRQLTGQSWQEFLLERTTEYFGAKLVGEETQASPVEWTPSMRQAIERQRMISHDENGHYILSVPVTIRGQPIGAVEVRLPEGLSNRSEARNIVQAVTERMAFSLENARLFEQARLAAEREQQINAITARLQGLTSIEDILATAVSTLSEVLAADQGTIRLVSRNVMTDADSDQRTTLETRTDQGRDAPAMTG
jgi:GAF domain-containing protein